MVDYHDIEKKISYFFSLKIYSLLWVANIMLCTFVIIVVSYYYLHILHTAFIKWCDILTISMTASCTHKWRYIYQRMWLGFCLPVK